MNWVRKLFRQSVFLAVLVALFALASCAAGPAPTPTAQPVAGAMAADEEGATPAETAVLATEPPGVFSGELTAEEADGIAFMREEERLARDVYVKLYEKWGLRAFQNILQSEETHMAAVKELIDRYGLEDPATEEVGVFTNQELQALYDQLIEQGYRSQADALRVGAAIEEIDILDLQERIEQTNHAEIATVYGNLLKGSRNHLRAFVNNLQRREGVTYDPQYLSQRAYDGIVAAEIGRRRGG